MKMLLLLLLAVPLEAQTGPSPGLADTLAAIAGMPRAVDVAPLPPDWLGSYSKENDIIKLSPLMVLYYPRHRPDSVVTWQTRTSPDWVLSHEFGHRFDKRRGYIPSRVWMREPYRTRAASPYANTHQEERWAEAFANAVDFLRYAAVEQRRDVVLRSLAQRETFIPGTSDVVEYLLRFGVFRSHPLNRRMRP